MHEHLTLEFFRAIHQGWRNPGDLAAVAMAHLFELCPRCREGFEDWRRDVDGASSPGRAGDFEAVLERAERSEAPAECGEYATAGSRPEARSRAEELLRLPAEQQADWIRTEAPKHSGLLLAEALIEECRRRTPGSPHEGVTLANLDRLVLHHQPTSAEATELYALALGHLANAVRVTGDLSRADQILGDARYLLRIQGGGARGLRATLDSLTGSLRMDQDRAAEAVPVLLRALMAQRLQSDLSAAVATLVKLAKAHGLQQADERALALLLEAKAILPANAEPRLTLLVRESAANYLRAEGRPEQGMEVYEQTEQLAEELGDPLHIYHRLWGQGWISAALGETGTAERHFSQARDGFVEKGVAYKATLVSWDLAKFYAREGRRDELEEILEPSLAAFHERGVHTKVHEVQALRAWAARP